MAKQTFTTGQVLTAAQLTNLQQTALGGGSPSVKTTSYVLVAADAGTVIQMNSTSATTVTVNTGLFSSGDSVQIQNIGAGTMTITAGTATVNSAGSLAVSQYDGGFLYFSSASSAIWFDYTQPGTTSPLTTKGDLYTRTSSGDTRLGVGANGTTLVADSAEATGLKWATPAGGMTLLNSGGTTLSGASTAVSFTSTGYTGLKIILKGVYVSTDAVAYFTLNNDSASNYSFAIVRGAGSVTRESNPSFGAYYYLFQTLPTANTTLLTGNGQIDLAFPTDTDHVSFVVNTLGGSTGNLTVSNGMGTYDSSAVISEIKFFIAAGTFSGGKAYVYGVK